MTTDHRGMPHLGSHGLYDDDEEFDATQKHFERRQRERLKSKIRQEEKRALREYRKEVKTVQMKSEGKSKLPRLASWFGKLSVRGRSSISDANSAKQVGSRNKDSGRATLGPSEIDFVVIRRPSTPVRAYMADDVVPLDSPWLRECGMVQVKSTDAGGCHIVQKSRIQKSE